MKKKLIAPLALAAALFSILPALAATGEGGSVQVTGWIVDEWCGQANANAQGKECSLDCHKKGAALVLFEPKAKKLYRLDNQKEAAKHVGEVTVTGKIEGDSLKVARIEPARDGK